MQTEPRETADSVPGRSDIPLVIVVAVALSLAIGSVTEDATRLPAGAFASVNGEVLPETQLQDVLRRLGDSVGHAAGPGERAEVIARLVDEELLLQQGLALGLVRADTRLRSQLVQEVIRQAVSRTAATPVEEAELRQFLARNEGYFRRPQTLVVERIRFADGADAARAAAGDTASLARGRRDDTLPATPLTAARWRDHLGSGPVERLATLRQGDFLREEGASVILRVAARNPGVLPPFEEIRPQVEAEFRRRRDEEALREYVARLRRDARIVTEAGGASP